MVQVGPRVESIGLGSLHNGEDIHAGTGPDLGIVEQPVLASDHNGADGVLRLVVTDLDHPVVEESAKVWLEDYWQVWVIDRLRTIEGSTCELQKLSTVLLFPEL